MNQQQESSNSGPEAPQRQRSSAWLVVLFVLLVFWIASIAAGAFLFGENVDWKKPAIVALPMLVFLGGWGLLLRSRRNQSRNS